MIEYVIKHISKSELREYILKNGIKSMKITFYKINFWHANVIGSGRFYYAEKAKEENY